MGGSRSCRQVSRGYCAGVITSHHLIGKHHTPQHMVLACQVQKPNVDSKFKSIFL